MASSKRIQQVQEAILNHLKSVGSHDWPEVKKDFLDIPTSSFWRYVKKAKEQLNAPPVPTVPADLFSREAGSVVQQEPWERPELNTVFCSLAHAQRLSEMHADLLALRQHALDSDGRIRDGQLFAKSIRLRTELLKDEVAIVEKVAATETCTKLLDAIFENVAKTSPEVAKAIIASMRGLQNEMAPGLMRNRAAAIN